MVVLGKLLGTTLFLLTCLPIVIKSKLTTKASLCFPQELECIFCRIWVALVICFGRVNIGNTIVGI